MAQESLFGLNQEAHKAKPVQILIRKDGPLTREDQIGAVSIAIRQRFASQLSRLEGEKREQFVKALATEFVHRAEVCAQAHLLRDLSSATYLTTATDEECRAFEEAAKDLVHISVAKPKTLGAEFYAATKHAAGITWKAALKLIGREDHEWIEEQKKIGGGGAGPRG